MRCAVFAATAHGVQLAAELQQKLDGSADIFVKKGREAAMPVHYYDTLGKAVRQAFYQYDALIFFMAAGIVVRLIAPYLKSKLTDPAVVVLDEQGKYAISLLSGHVGGANELTRQIAAICASAVLIGNPACSRARRTSA